MEGTWKEAKAPLKRGTELEDSLFLTPEYTAKL